jgi:hypothetical protein
MILPPLYQHNFRLCFDDSALDHRVASFSVDLVQHTANLKLTADCHGLTFVRFFKVDKISFTHHSDNRSPPGVIFSVAYNATIISHKIAYDYSIRDPAIHDLDLRIDSVELIPPTIEDILRNGWQKITTE